MFDKLGRAVSGHPWWWVAVWVLLVSVASTAALWGFGQGGIFERLSNSVSLVPGTESDTVNKLTSADAGGVTLTVVIDKVNITTQAKELAQVMADHRSDLSSVTGVKSVVDGFQFPDPKLPQAQALFSSAADGFVILVNLDPGLTDGDLKTTEADVADAVVTLQDNLRRVVPAATAQIVSTSELSNAIMAQIRDDLIRGEGVGLPVALLLLIIVFGGFLAAGLPIVGAIVTIGVGMGAMWTFTFSTTVESFIINITTIIGLALSVDYGLLIVSRYREELARTLEKYGYATDGSRIPRKHAASPVVREAMATTIRTAGRTVFFSALTIAVALSALLTLKAAMMRMISLSGIIVTLLAVATAVTLVPAMVVIMRRSLIKPSLITRIPGLRRVVKAVGDSAKDDGFFSKLAQWVHRHPIIIMIAVIAVLGVMAFPLRDMQVRTAFTDYMPEEAASTQGYNLLQKNYPALMAPTIVVVADRPPDKVDGLFKHLSELADVDFVSPPAALQDDAGRSVISVHIDVENQVGSQITKAVTDLREYDAGYPILVGGPAALQHDFVRSILDSAPLALTIMVLAVFLLMFLMTGSVIVPVKAIIINSFSLLASLGATSFIFMNGWFGMPKVMGMETFIIVCALCFGFGLAMDYEVFLIARIREYWDAGTGNDEAVERGLQRSGRIITSAAAIIVAVFIGFTVGKMVPIKEIGVALAITVITDATLVRMLLVPATMTILGKWNWWAPKPMRLLYDKLKIVH